jgi:hypothetical protein
MVFLIIDIFLLYFSPKEVYHAKYWGMIDFGLWGWIQPFSINPMIETYKNIAILGIILLIFFNIINWKKYTN